MYLDRASKDFLTCRWLEEMQKMQRPGGWLLCRGPLHHGRTGIICVERSLPCFCLRTASVGYSRLPRTLRLGFSSTRSDMRTSRLILSRGMSSIKIPIIAPRHTDNSQDAHRVLAIPRQVGHGLLPQRSPWKPGSHQRPLPGRAREDARAADREAAPTLLQL